MYKKFLALLFIGTFSASYAMIGDVVGAATGAAQGALGIGEAAVGTATGTVSRAFEPSPVEPAPIPVIDESSVGVEPIDETPAIETTGRDLIVEDDTTPAAETLEDVDLTLDTNQNDDMTETPETTIQVQDTETEMADPDPSGTDISDTDTSGTGIY